MKGTTAPRHFLSSHDLSPAEQAALVDRAAELKRTRRRHPRPLDGRSVAMIFEKPSTRTRISFELAVVELGAHPVVLRGDELQLGRGETLEDTARVLSRYVHAVVIRTFGQERLTALAAAATVPVINALSDHEHPCQALADVQTIAERFPDPRDVVLAYLGDGNNVAHSLLLAGANAGYAEVRVSSPAGYEPDPSVVAGAEAIGAATGTAVRLLADPVEASKGATVLYTDVWASMGQEAERASRLAALAGHALTGALLEAAAPEAVAMHCLPAHRGEEIAADVIDGPRSVVWDQAENRLHAQKALLELVAGQG
ncbi:MAG: ornithine carbamoyltransferase [Actinomycetota bacterium]